MSSQVLNNSGWKHHNLSWQSVLVVDHVNSKKEFFLLFKWYFNLCQLPLYLSLVLLERIFLFTTPHWLLIHMVQIHQNLPFPSLNSQCLFIYQVLHPACPSHFCTGESALDSGFQISFASAQWRGRIISFSGEGVNAGQRAVDCLCSKDALLAHGQLVVL